MSAQPTQQPLRFQVAPAPYNDRYERVFGSQLRPDDVTAVLKLADMVGVA